MSVIRNILKIGVPAVTGAAVIGTLGVLLYQTGREVDDLKSQLAESSIPIAEEKSAVEFAPIDVNHHYERLGQKILLSDDTFGQIWIPVLSDVALSQHPLEQMVLQPDGRMTSFDDAGNLNAMTGIDISTHNPVSDWNRVKADGIDFVMLRVGYRGYGIDTGTIHADDKFRQYYRDAKAAGLLVGAYFFSQAITEEEAVEEAVFTAEQLKGCELDFPVAYDWELIFHDNEARTNNVPVETLTDATLAFCQNIESFGYQPMIYQNKRTSLFKLDLPRLQGIPFWLAEYGDGPTYIYDYGMWQYSCNGIVDGISGSVDMNLCFFDYSQADTPAISVPAPDSIITPEEAKTTEPAESTDTTADSTDITETDETTALPVSDADSAEDSETE